MGNTKILILVLFSFVLFHYLLNCLLSNEVISESTELITLDLLNRTLNSINSDIHAGKVVKKNPKLNKTLSYNVTGSMQFQIVRTKQVFKKALVFTMDSISTYEENSLHGGAAGELIVRRCLEYAFKLHGVMVTVIRSDQEFSNTNLHSYDIIILDPWTWADKGWVPKKNLIGLESRIFILDFFGSEKLRGNGLKIAQKRILTAYGSPWNTFLGYFIEDRYVEHKQRNFGVIWGKDPNHFQGRESDLRALANTVELYCTCTSIVFHHPRVHWIGHQSKLKWNELLKNSAFLIGLGNPLIGPSAIDAISFGCMYLNPIFDDAKKDGLFLSQHPFAEKIGLPYVCSFKQTNLIEMKKCAELALSTNLSSYIPIELKIKKYIERVKNIFDL